MPMTSLERNLTATLVASNVSDLARYRTPKRDTANFFALFVPVHVATSVGISVLGKSRFAGLVVSIYTSVGGAVWADYVDKRLRVE